MGHPAEKRQHHSLEEYFRISMDSQEKLEYDNGRIVAMAGGTDTHSLISANAIGELRSLLKGSICRVYDANLRIKLAKSVRYVYPDVSVICGPVEYDPADTGKHTAINPKLIVEVLSESSHEYDRGVKMRHYLEIPSVQEYVLITQQFPWVEVYARQADGSWTFRFGNGLESSVLLSSVNVTLALSEVYAGVVFPPEKENKSPLASE